MQDPSKEIASIVLLLITTVSPDIQKATAEKYLTPDVGFRHPLCNVPPSSSSRETLLGIYQWYRVMSPKIEADVNSVVYDEENQTIFLDVAQTFHIRLSPFKPTKTRLLVRVTLREINRLYYIAFQEDFYHPDDFANLVVPPLAPVIRLALTSTSVASNLYAKIAQTLGFWRVSDWFRNSANAPATRREQDHEHDERGLYDGNKTD